MPPSCSGWLVSCFWKSGRCSGGGLGEATIGRGDGTSLGDGAAGRGDGTSRGDGAGFGGGGGAAAEQQQVPVDNYGPRSVRSHFHHHGHRYWVDWQWRMQD